MNILEELHKFDTAEISDALDACGIEGALLNVKPLSPGMKMVGPAFTVKYLPYVDKVTTFNGAGNYIDDVPESAVIVIDNQGKIDCTTWGDILTQVAIIRNIAGTVVYGACRDVEFIRNCKYPLFSSSVYMRSGKNRVFKSEQQIPLQIANIMIRPGDIIMGDDNGVIIIPVEFLSDVLEKAKNIKKTEEAIIKAVKSGMSLEAARKLHRYDQPWLDLSVKQNV